MSFAKRLGLTSVVVLLVLALIAAVWKALDILLLIFAGIVLGLFLHTVKEFVCSKLRLPHWAGALLVILVLFTSLVLFFIGITPILVEQLKTLGDTVTRQWGEMRNYFDSTMWGQRAADAMDYVAGWSSRTWLNEEGFMSNLSSLFTTTLGFLGSVIIVLLTAIYILVEPEMYLQGTIRLFPLSSRQRLREVAARIAHVLKWWMVGQICSMTILGVLMTLGLWMLGVPMALAIGLFTALMTFIPNLGPIIAAVPAILIALTVNPATAFYTFLLILVIQNLEGTLITPTIHRKIIALPPLLIIGVQLFLGSLAGFTGVLIAMPLVAVVMVLVQELYIKDVLGEEDDAMEAKNEKAGESS